MGYLTFGAIMLAALTAACSDSSKSVGAAGKAGPAVTKVEDNKSVSGVDAYQNVQGQTFVTKNYIQLKAAASACLGADKGIISAAMFSPGRCQNMAAPAQPNAADKLYILGADLCGAVGMNVYDALKTNLWDPNLAATTDTLSNELTPDYLTALATAADVYAFTVDNPQDLCGTVEAARTLLGNCIGQIDGKVLDQAAPTIASLCSQGPTQARAGIALALGNAAFAAAAPPDGAPPVLPTSAASGSATGTDTDAGGGTATDAGIETDTTIQSNNGT